jgi:hypothetical protein
MAVSLGPGGLSGDGGGVLVSTGDMTTLGHSGQVSTDVDIPLPTGYDHFRVFFRFKTAGGGSDRAVVWFQVKDSGGTRLSMECNSWHFRRGTAGSNNGTVTQEYNSASTWTRLGSFIDGSNVNFVEFTVDGTSNTRPGITWTGNHTYGSVGSTMFIGSAHYNSVTQYRSIGLNADTYDLAELEYRVIGYVA